MLCRGLTRAIYILSIEHLRASMKRAIRTAVCSCHSGSHLCCYSYVFLKECFIGSHGIWVESGSKHFWKCWIRVGNFRPKNYSAEDGMDGTLGLFRRNFGEQKTLGILFRTISWKRKMLGILNSGTNLEANPRNAVPNYSAEEKMLGIL